MAFVASIKNVADIPIVRKEWLVFLCLQWEEVIKMIKWYAIVSFALFLFLLPPDTFSARNDHSEAIFNMLASKTGFKEARDIRRQFKVLAPNARIANSVLKIATRTRASFYKYLNCTRHWDHPTIIKIYPTKKMYKFATGHKGSVGFAVFMSTKGIKKRLIAAYYDHEDFENTLHHEIVHQLTRDLAVPKNYIHPKNVKKMSTPLWIDEGLAEYLTANKKGRDKYKIKVGKALKENRAFSLIELISFKKYPSRDPILFYAQSYSLISFLAKVPNFRVKLRNLATSSYKLEPRQRLLKPYSRDFNNLNEISMKWRKYAMREYVRTKGKQEDRKVTAKSASVSNAGLYIMVIVDEILDGDTLKVIYNGNKESVRLIGVDTPESKVNKKAKRDAKKSGDDIKVITAMGKEATLYTKSLVKKGDMVTLKFDVQKRDRYRRLLGYVYLKNGKMLNEEIVKGGYASPMTIPPNVKYQSKFLKAYKKARQYKKGLWK